MTIAVDMGRKATKKQTIVDDDFKPNAISIKMLCTGSVVVKKVYKYVVTIFPIKGSLTPTNKGDRKTLG